MPELVQASWTHWLVVWQKTDTKTRYGQPRLGSPTEIRCRWIINDQASPTQEITREDYPRSVPVAKEIALGSIIWGPGKITDLPSSPIYFEVTSISKTPDLKGRHPAYRVTLQKASKTLPELV